MRLDTSTSTERGTPVVVALMGPTATGKSALAMSLARRWSAEIISADSAMVYRQTSIGTAKPNEADRAEVPHHLIDIRDLGEGFCLADFQRLAGALVEEIWQRGHIPLVVGGTGLYVRGLLEGYSLEAPKPDMALRQQLNDRDLPSLLDELAERDPATYAVIDRCNRRRVSRALEVVLQSGRSFLECSKRQPPPWRVLKLGVSPERDLVRERIARRLQRMLEAGWEEEVRTLLAQGWEERLQEANILGYSWVISAVKGECGREAMTEGVFQDTCRFAKRQRTWLRAEPGLVMLPWEAREAQANELLAALLAER